MSEPNSREELEQKLLADKSFQHILKLAPESQRELMTFELAKYFDQHLTNQLKKAVVEARSSTAKIYEKEIKNLRAFQESVVKREQLKTEPSLVICGACYSKLQSTTNKESDGEAERIKRNMEAWRD